MKIYTIHIRTVEGASSGELMQLMPERYARFLRYLRREDQLRCLGAGLLVHRVLGIPESELRLGRYGKPYAPGRAEFSLSHGGNWAVLGIGDVPVGVDIEPMNPANLEIAHRVYTPDEISWMQRSPLERFHILWTIKESIMKAAGLGMQLDPAGFDVLPIGGPNAAAGKNWHAAWTLLDGCALACASENEIESLDIEEIRL